MSSSSPSATPASPSFIPPRTSSSGQHAKSSSVSSPTPPPALTRPLDPPPEADWLSQKTAPLQSPPRSSSLNSHHHRGASSSASTGHQHHGHQRQKSSLTYIPSPLPLERTNLPSSSLSPPLFHFPSPFSLPTMPAAAAAPAPPPSTTTKLTNGHAPAHGADRYEFDDLNFSAQRSWTAEKESVVRGPFDYALSHPGKDFRSLLIGAFNAWLEVPQSSLDIITRVVGMLHESSLLVDDVQDSSELRRGAPVAHSIFGVAQTINSANYIYFTALQELLRLGNANVIPTFAEELVNLHRGQGMDLFWRDTLTCPSEDDYLEMVGNKTGGLFRLGIQLMQAESTVDMDCIPLVNLIGLIFQIRDDYMNLSSPEYSQNKGMYEDLTEGKFSFPVIHSIRANPANLQLLNILKQKTTDVEVKRYAVRYMEGTGSFSYTREVIGKLIERARKTAAEIDQGRGKLAGINMILDRMAV